MAPPNVFFLSVTQPLLTFLFYGFYVLFPTCCVPVKALTKFLGYSHDQHFECCTWKVAHLHFIEFSFWSFLLFFFFFFTWDMLLCVLISSASLHLFLCTRRICRVPQPWPGRLAQRVSGGPGGAVIPVPGAPRAPFVRAVCPPAVVGPRLPLARRQVGSALGPSGREARPSPCRRSRSAGAAPPGGICSSGSDAC